MEEIKLKAGAYSDDALTLCGSDNESVKGVFKQYERLTRKSGLELNAEKTEILSLHTDSRQIKGGTTKSLLVFWN